MPCETYGVLLEQEHEPEDDHGHRRNFDAIPIETASTEPIETAETVERVKGIEPSS